MKYLIAFVLCLSCSLTKTFAIYNVGNQGFIAAHSVVSTPNVSTVSTTKKLRYKDRVALKYKQFKAKINNKRWAIGFLVGGGVTLLIGLLLMAPFNKLTDPNSPNTATVNQGVSTGIAYLLGIVVLCLSGLLFIAALVAALI